MDRFTVKELKAALKEKGLKCSGNKAMLMERLRRAGVKPQDFTVHLGVQSEADLRPEDSVSQLSKGSATSYCSERNSLIEKRVSEAADRAGLLAKGPKLIELQRLEEEELRVRQRKERIKLEAELAELEARDRVLEEYEEKIVGGSIIEKTKEKILDGSEEKKGRSAQEEGSMSSNSRPKFANVESELVKQLVQYNLKGLMPKLEVQKFEGDITQYQSFVRSFDSKIIDKLSDEEEKLNYLEQYTGGKPRDIVRACMHMNRGRGYKEARSLLDRRYGNPEKIIAGFVDKILGWPDMGAEEVDSLDEFSIMLASCKNAVTKIPLGSSELDNPKTMRKILKKVPSHMQERFRRRADEISENQRRPIKFDDLVEFIQDEARIASNPQFGRHFFRELKSTLVQCNATKEERKPKCWLCEGSHLLEECKKLKEKKRKEIVSFLLEKGLCFKCLRPGHISRDCSTGKACNICSGNHHVLLHSTRPRTEPNTASGEIDDSKNVCGSIKNTNTFRMSVVPIKIVSREGKSAVTYAFLDNGSSVTFCTNSLLTQLKMDGEETTPIELDVSTIHKTSKISCQLVNCLTVLDLEGNHSIPLPPVYAVDKLPVSEDDILRRADLRRYPSLHHLDIPELKADIGLLIGINVPEALEPWEIIHTSDKGGPYAVKTKLGWVVCGTHKNHELMLGTKRSMNVNKIRVNGASLEDTLRELYNKDFPQLYSNRLGESEEDRMWLSVVESGCKKTLSGRYEIPLPLKKHRIELPNNRDYALRRVLNLRKRLKKDDKYRGEYFQAMNEMIKRGYAEEVPSNEVGCYGQKFWYIPHFGVYHPRKPGKIRIVFDCAAKFKGVCLNDILLQGPDITNSLIDVLCRFRQGRYAYIADVEKMFYQVLVPRSQRNYLKFLWWKNDNLNENPTEFRMTVHLFGACSSPSIANYALQKTAIDYSQEFDDGVVQTIRRNFYVDDCLKSLDNERELINNAEKVRELCSRGGFVLTKFVSRHELLTRVIAKGALNELERGISDGPTRAVETTLGVSWNIETDCMQVVDKSCHLPTSKRTLLATIAGIFDPFGMISPLVLQGRLIMQELSRSKVGWDERLNPEIGNSVFNWFLDMKKSSDVLLDRSYAPPWFGSLKSVELHYFADASARAYGVVSYLRWIDRNENVHVSFLYGRAKVAPIKSVTIPRLELTAAALAVKVNEMIMNALDFHINVITFWTDSTTVLRYIHNDSARFQVFVANKLALIKDGSQAAQWQYVSSKLNPADDASRGKQTGRWIKGPDFLWANRVEWTKNLIDIGSSLEGLEIKKPIVCAKVEVTFSPLRKLIAHYSSWLNLKRAVAWILIIKDRLTKNETKRSCNHLVLKDLQRAELSIISFVQSQHFSCDINWLGKGKCVPKNSYLRKLRPIYHHGLLRVGGRLGYADGLTEEEKHPIILPYKDHLTDIIIQHFHTAVGHLGRTSVLASLRRRFWVIKGNSAVRAVLSNCVTCRKLQGKPILQQMAELPPDRAAEDRPPFTYTGVDCFGPFYVMKGRSQAKRYGVIFTCLTIRAVHLEVAIDLSTGAFINCLRRFIARRGCVELIRCDHGRNFIGAKNELKSCLDNWNRSEVGRELLAKGIEWIFNPPHSSHFGGVWERQIRSVRKVLEATTSLQNLTDDSLQTFFCEVEAIINSRPLVVTTSDCKDVPLSPSQLLTLKGSPSGVLGTFQAEDNYCRRRWRQVQHLANVFWKRWKYEYLLGLHERQK